MEHPPTHRERCPFSGHLRPPEEYRARHPGTRAAINADPRMARLEVSGGQQSCEVDLLEEAIGPSVHLEVGPVLAFDDAVGLKMRALHDRAAHRDFIDGAGALRIVKCNG